MNICSPEYDVLANKKIMVDGFQVAMKYLADVTDLNITPPESPRWLNYGNYNRAVRALEADNFDVARSALISASEESQLGYRGARLFGKPYISTTEHEIIEATFKKNDSDKVIRIGELESSDLTNAEMEKLKICLSIMQSELPTFFAEFYQLVDEILFVGPEGENYIRSASSFDMYGLMLVLAESENTILHYVEHLIHEMAHIALFPASASDDLVFNPPDQRFSAPFRKDLRPMGGIFHAHFVLSRILQALTKLTSSRSPHVDFTELNERLAKSRISFEQTKAIIVEHGKLTPYGWEIFHGCNALVREPEYIS